MRDEDLEPTVIRLFESIGAGARPTHDERHRIEAAMRLASIGSTLGDGTVQRELWIEGHTPIFTPTMDTIPRTHRSSLFTIAVAATVALIALAAAVLIRGDSTALDVADGAPAPTIRVRDHAGGGLVQAVESQIGEAIVAFETEEDIVIESFGPSHLLVRPTDYVNPFANADRSLGGRVLLFVPSLFDDEASLDVLLGELDLDVQRLRDQEGLAATTIIVPDRTVEELGCAHAAPCVIFDDRLANGPTPALESGFINDVRLFASGNDTVAMLTLHTGTRIGTNFDAVTRLRDDVASSLRMNNG